MRAIDVDRELAALYGGQVLPKSGILHTVHAVRAESGRLHALRIDENAPRSETDWFVLSLCRARADALLTSAENLRREPQLVHRLTGPWAEALGEYRLHTLAKATPLHCAILTRSGDLPHEHPVWSDGTHKLLLCPPQAEASLRARFADRAEVIAAPGLDAAVACTLLRQRGLDLISLEAGPSSAASLYAGPIRVTELWLTLWESAPASAALAGALPEDAVLFEGLTRLGASVRTEAGQRFRFERWKRA
jgi:riboflavin biosynthesis pyrimidine reductase